MLEAAPGAAPGAEAGRRPGPASASGPLAHVLEVVNEFKFVELLVRWVQVSCFLFKIFPASLLRHGNGEFLVDTSCWAVVFE